eukprot:10981262-Alexandrium_andersonii.AAC.1
MLRSGIKRVLLPSKDTSIGRLRAGRAGTQKRDSAAYGVRTPARPPNQQTRERRTCSATAGKAG